MKFLVAVLLLITSCNTTPTNTWEKVATNVPQIVALEDRVMDIATAVAMAYHLDNRQRLEIKLHLDIYFIFYSGANAALANGKMAEFDRHMKAAETELDRMMEIMSAIPQESDTPGRRL